MRSKLLLAGSVAALALTTVAQAADVVRSKPLVASTTVAAVQAVPTYSFAGAYAGINVGYKHLTYKEKGADNKYTGEKTVSLLPVGGFVGYNAQFGSMVVGADLKVDYIFDVSKTNETTITSQLDGFARIRAGFALDRVLFYAAGGLAVERAKFGTEANNDDHDKNAIALGYTAGAGVEYALMDNVVLRGEYHFEQYYKTLTKGATKKDVTGIVHNVSAGVAYKF